MVSLIRIELALCPRGAFPGGYAGGCHTLPGGRGVPDPHVPAAHPGGGGGLPRGPPGGGGLNGIAAGGGGGPGVGPRGGVRRSEMVVLRGAEGRGGGLTAPTTGGGRKGGGGGGGGILMRCGGTTAFPSTSLSRTIASSIRPPDCPENQQSQSSSTWREPRTLRSQHMGSTETGPPNISAHFMGK